MSYLKVHMYIREILNLLLSNLEKIQFQLNKRKFLNILLFKTYLIEEYAQTRTSDSKHLSAMILDVFLVN